MTSWPLVKTYSTSVTCSHSPGLTTASQRTPRLLTIEQVLASPTSQFTCKVIQVSLSMNTSKLVSLMELPTYIAMPLRYNLHICIKAISVKIALHLRKLLISLWIFWFYVFTNSDFCIPEINNKHNAAGIQKKE